MRPCPASAEPLRDLIARHFLALAGPAILELGLAGRHPLRADDHLPGRADQVHVGELGAGPEIAVVVQSLDALGSKAVIEFLAGAGHGAVARLQVDDGALERRPRPRPDDARLVVTRLDDAADQARHADTV